MGLTNKQKEKNKSHIITAGQEWATRIDDFTCKTGWVNNNPLYSVVFPIFISFCFQMHTDLFGIVGQRAGEKNTECDLSLFKIWKTILEFISHSLPEFKWAVLPVEGKVVDVDGTWASEYSRGQPVYEPIVIQYHIGVVCHLKLGIIAAVRMRGI